ncbi:hypothetical protein [Microbacterium sp. 18062]|uniref:hypothetical protein n=1 Tax=Microbacterium sp. 18062 TaxID=2681410 RepID=UPI00135CCA4C|nr:hypothetical protein [Microbacterium sp. 18062]
MYSDISTAAAGWAGGPTGVVERQNPGWMRAVDVPAESAANPRTARTFGIR